LILDGQQRTTTAYHMFYGVGDFRFYFDYKEFFSRMKSVEPSEVVDIVESKMDDWLVVKEARKAVTNQIDQFSEGLLPLESFKFRLFRLA